MVIKFELYFPPFKHVVHKSYYCSWDSSFSEVCDELFVDSIQEHSLDVKK